MVTCLHSHLFAPFFSHNFINNKQNCVFVYVCTNTHTNIHSYACICVCVQVYNQNILTGGQHENQENTQNNMSICCSTYKAIITVKANCCCSCCQFLFCSLCPLSYSLYITVNVVGGFVKNSIKTSMVKQRTDRQTDLRTDRTANNNEIIQILYHS